MTGVRSLSFATPYQKARWMAGNAVLDSHAAAVRAHAAPFAEIRDAAARATALHRHVRDTITYVRDPGGVEQLGDASTCLSRGFGDCDDKHRLLVALALAAEKLAPVGLEAKLVPVFLSPSHFSHVSAAFRYPGSAHHQLANADGWIRAETILAGVELGQGAEAAQRDARGAIRYA